MPDSASPRRPTIEDVAAEAGISFASAARALGGYGKVSERTRRLALDAADRIGYKVNGLARSMATGSTRTIGLIVADIENPFFARVARGVYDAAGESGFEVLLANTDETPAAEVRALQVMVERRVDGVVVAPASSQLPEHLRGAIDHGLQIVLIDRDVAGLHVSSVAVDNRSATSVAIKYLHDLGHRRIGLLSGLLSLPSQGLEAEHPDSTRSPTGLERLAGYRLTADDLGLDADPRLVRTGGFDPTWAEQATRELLQLEEPPSAILALDGVLALGMVRAVRSLGTDVPKELALMTFDDPDWAAIVEPPLTAIAQPAYDIGRKAAQRLMDQLAGDRTVVRQVLTTDLVRRASTERPLAAAEPAATARHGDG